jgi:hypothetical protein
VSRRRATSRLSENLPPVRTLLGPQKSVRKDARTPICLLICRDGEASGKDRLDRAASDRAAPVLAASARAGVTARRIARARAQSGSGSRHLRLRLVRCAHRVQLLVRRAYRAGRDRSRADSARLRETQPKSVGAVPAAPAGLRRAGLAAWERGRWEGVARARRALMSTTR